MRKQTKKNLFLGFVASFAVASGASLALLNNVTADAENASLSFRAGASVRTADESMGIRFTANLSESLLDTTGETPVFKAGTEVGMIITPEWVLSGVTDSTDVFTYLKDGYGVEKSEVSVVLKDNYIQKDSTGYYAWASIVDLLDKNLAETYQAIAYTYDETNGYQYSAKSDARTISYVLNAELSVDDLEAEDRMTVVKAIGSISEKLAAAGKAEASELTIETDVATGLDLSAYAVEGNAITAATLGETDLTVSGNKVAFANADALNEIRTLTLTYEDGTTVNLNAKVWSLIIDNETELKAAKNYEWYVVRNTYQVPYGYYKLNADITMTANWGAEYAIAASGSPMFNGGAYGFQGVFDGNGHKLTNFNVPAGAHRASLIGYMGSNGVVKNLTMSGSHGTTGSSTMISGYLISHMGGGTVENVKLTVSMAEGYAGVSGTTNYLLANGALLGRTVSNDILAITIKDVVVQAADTTTSNRNYAPAIIAFGNNANTAGAAETWKEKLTMTNVSVVGFKTAITTWARDLFQTTESLKNIAVCTNVNMFATESEYLDSLTTVLTAVETDVATGLDLNAVLAAQNVTSPVKSIVCGTEEVTLADGKIAYALTDASETAKNYVITTEDGKQYKLSVTVWSLLIDNETELRAMQNYVYSKEIYKWGDREATEAEITAGSSAKAWYGYFKLNDDISCVEKWTKSEAVVHYNNQYYVPDAKNPVSYVTRYHGFRGIFEGNNKTISNLNMTGNYTSLFGCVGNDAVVRNVNFTGVTLPKAPYVSALIASCADGGTFENINISAMITADAYGAAGQPSGVLFGRIGLNGSGYCGQITLKNIHMDITQTTLGQWYYLIGGYQQASDGYTLPICENVTVVGFSGNLIGWNVLKDATPDDRTTYDGVTVFANQEAYEDYLDSLTEKTVVAQATTNYLIAVPASATTEETGAAQVFKKYFEQATGATVAVVSDSQIGEWDKSKQVISIGNTALANTASVFYYGDSESGYKIESIGNTVFLVGGKYGVKYAVYGLLEEWFSFDAFGPDAYFIDEGVSELSYTKLNIRELPSIEYRLPYQSGVRFDSTLRGAMRFNDISAIVGPNGARTHNSLLYLPMETYYENNPHWYVVGDRSQLCYSVYEEYIDIVVEQAKTYLQASEEGYIVTFSVEDTSLWCTCEKCVESLEKYGTNAAVYVKFLNALAEKLNTWATEQNFGKTVKVEGLAYLATAKAPVTYDAATDTYAPIDDSVALKNVYISATAVGLDWQAEGGWQAEENAEVYANLRSWSAIAEKLSMWTYNQYPTGYGDYFLFYETFSGIQNVYQTLAENGCYYLIDLGQYDNGNATGFNVLRGYLSSKLGWNANADVEELTDKFFDGYFGAASGAMRKMYDRTVERFAEKYGYDTSLGQVSYKQTNTYWIAGQIYSTAFLREIEGYIAEAYAAIEGLKTTNETLYNALKDRIALEELAIRFLYLNGSYLLTVDGAIEYDFVKDSSGNCIFSAEELAQMQNEFKADCERLGVTHCSEGKALSVLWERWGMTVA